MLLVRFFFKIYCLYFLELGFILLSYEKINFNLNFKRLNNKYLFIVMFLYIRVMVVYVNIRFNLEVCSVFFFLFASSNL